MAMYCPSCGATIKKPDQRYCQDCGTTLPDPRGGPPAVRGQAAPSTTLGGGGNSNVLDRRQGMMFGLVPATLKNRALIYGGGLVVAVVAIYIVVSAIVHALLALLPLFIVVVLAYIGFQVWRSRSR